MIATCTPNPSVDRTIQVAAVERGAVLRGTAARSDPAGKGVNVARALTANGFTAVAVLPCGGGEGEQLQALLDQAGIKVRSVGISSAIRMNVTLAEPDGTVTKVNEPGPSLRPDEVERLLEATVDEARAAGRIACCGSLPPGAGVDFYARVLHRLPDVDATVDTSGPELAAAIEARPGLIKPNHDELAELAGRPLPRLGDVVEAAAGIRERGVGRVLVSLGADGAVLVDGSGAVHGETDPVTVRSAVGAGDALLAGYLSALDGDDGHGAHALARGLAWGAAAAALAGSRMPGPDEVARIRVRIHTDIDNDRQL